MNLAQSYLAEAARSYVERLLTAEVLSDRMKWVVVYVRLDEMPVRRFRVDIRQTVSLTSREIT